MRHLRGRLERGMQYVVTERGAACPFQVGDVVEMHDHWTVDFLSGETVMYELRRVSDGLVAEIRRGPTGCILRPV